jgi:recombination protein RecA
MASRPRPSLTPPPPDPATESDVEFFSSGSTLLNLVLGGGWARGRIANIVGDKSSGKTLLATEAFANFDQRYPSALMRYAESEAAYDRGYAETMGMPKRVEYPEPGKEVSTVNRLDVDLVSFLDRTNGAGGLYCLDSLDALSDDAELKRGLGDATYGTEKAKLLSELFRRRIVDIRTANTTMIVVSQIRDNIGVMFGEQKKRAGGRALDFYASQIIWLAEIQKIKRTVLGVEQPVGVRVLANCKKNKVGTPYRRAEFSVLLKYGVDDENSMLDWLVKHKADGALDAPVKEYRTLIGSIRDAQDRPALTNLNTYLAGVVTAHWNRIEDAMQPPMGKYA